MAWFRCIGSSGGGSTPTRLPYNPDDSDYTLSDSALSDFKAAIDAYNTANGVTAIDWNTANVVVVVSYAGMWDDYSTYTDIKQTHFYIYSSNTVVTSFSSGKNFSNFVIDNSGCTITINDGSYAHYTVYKRRMDAGNRYAGWNVDYESVGVLYKTYFGDRTLVQKTSTGEEGNFSYIPNYPVWVSKTFTTTDGQGQTGNFLYKAPVVANNEIVLFENGEFKNTDKVSLLLSSNYTIENGRLKFTTNGAEGFSFDTCTLTGQYTVIIGMQGPDSITTFQYGISDVGTPVASTINQGLNRREYATRNVNTTTMFAICNYFNNSSYGAFFGNHSVSGRVWYIDYIKVIPM